MSTARFATLIAWSIALCPVATRLSAGEIRLPEEWEAVVDATVATFNAGPASRDFLNIASVSLEWESLAVSCARNPFRIDAILTTPEVSAAAKTAGAGAPAGDDDLSRTDDARLAISFNASSRRFGRSIAPHKALFESMLLTLPDPETTGGNDFPRAVETYVSDFATLLASQPQIHISGLVHRRRDLIGPSMSRATVTWESATRNLNRFRATEGKACGDGKECARAFRRYVKRTRGSSRGRWALSLSYDRISRTAPVVANRYSTPEAAGLTYSAAYGRPVPSLLRGRDSRLDLSLTHDGTTARSSVATPAVSKVRTQWIPRSYDRWIAAAVYTQRLSDRLLLPVSLVWSDHSESVPGACRQVIVSPISGIVCEPPVTSRRQPLVLHFGVTYRIPPPALKHLARESPYCCR